MNVVPYNIDENHTFTYVLFNILLFEALQKTNATNMPFQNKMSITVL